MRPINFSAMLGAALKEKGPVPKRRIIKERKLMPVTKSWRVQTSILKPNGEQLTIPPTMRVHKNGPESERDTIVRAVVNHDRTTFQKFVYRAIYDTPHSRTSFFDVDCDDAWESIVDDEKCPKQFFFYSMGGKSNQRTPIAVALQFSKIDFVFCLVDAHYLEDTMSYYHIGST